MSDSMQQYNEAVAQLEDVKYVSQRDLYAVIHSLQHIATDMNKGYVVKRGEDMKLMVDTMLLFIEGLVPKEKTSVDTNS